MNHTSAAVSTMQVSLCSVSECSEGTIQPLKVQQTVLSVKVCDEIDPRLSSSATGGAMITSHTLSTAGSSSSSHASSASASGTAHGSSRRDGEHQTDQALAVTTSTHHHSDHRTSGQRSSGTQAQTKETLQTAEDGKGGDARVLDVLLPTGSEFYTLFVLSLRITGGRMKFAGVNKNVSKV